MLLLTSSMVLGIPTIVHAETTEDAVKEQVGTDYEVSAESEDIGTVSSRPIRARNKVETVKMARKQKKLY